MVRDDNNSQGQRDCHGVTCAESQETLSDGVLINKLFCPYISLQVAQVSTSFES